MSLSPDDIVGFEFKQSLRGYAVDEVDDLLDRLADQVERTERELDELRQRLRDTEARLASALETESTLKRTLVTAQQAAEQAMADAREQADELRHATEREAAEQLEQSRAEADRTLYEARAEAERSLSEARAEAERSLSEARAEAERSLSEAHAEAEQLLAQARADVRTEIHDATQRRAAVEQRIETLEDLEHRHRTLLERHLRDQLGQLEALSRDAGEVVAERTGGEAPELTIRVHSDDELPGAAPGDESVHDEGAPAPTIGDAWATGTPQQDEQEDAEELTEPPEPWRDRGPLDEESAEPWRDPAPEPDAPAEPWRDRGPLDEESPEPWRDPAPEQDAPAEPWRDSASTDEPTQPPPGGDAGGEEGEDDEPSSPEPRTYEIPESPDQDLWAWSKPGPAREDQADHDPER